MGLFKTFFASPKKSGGKYKTTAKTKTHSPKSAPKNKKSSGSKTKRQSPPARTTSGKVPLGRTLSTNDRFLPGAKTGSTKKRPVVVIETNDKNDLAVVPLSSRDGNNRTKLKNYGNGKSYFKHFVETEDDEGKAIRVNEKFKENHPDLDLSRQDVGHIRDTVFKHSKPMEKNKRKIEKFRKKNPRD